MAYSSNHPNNPGDRCLIFYLFYAGGSKAPNILCQLIPLVSLMQFCSLLPPVISALESVAREMPSLVDNIGQRSM